jgi:hypothetical protein
MCLFNASRVYIAKEDIVVYKHVIKCKDGYVSSYRKSVVLFDKLCTSDIEFVRERQPQQRIIERALHSFVNLNDARQEAKHWKEVLVRCIIPKGSRYHKGEFGGIYRVDSLASNQLIYTEIVEDYSKGRKALRISDWI